MNKTQLTLLGTTLLTGSAFGAIQMNYNGAASDPTNGLFVYDDDISLPTGPPQVCVTAKIWDDSANTFVLGQMTQTGTRLAWTSMMSLDAGDFLCIELAYKDASGNPVFVTPVVGAESAQLASSMNVDTNDNNLGDEVVMVFQPGTSAGHTFDATAAVVGLPGTDNSTGFVTGSGLGSGFDDIDALTGGATSSYFTFAGVESQQLGALRDNTAGAQTQTDGHTWYVGNVGPDSIASGTTFRMTINGVAALPIPEPSVSLLVALGMGAFLRRSR